MNKASARVLCLCGITLSGVAASVAQLSASGCSSTPRPASTVDCDVVNQYDFSLDDPMTPIGDNYQAQCPPWFGYGDNTPGAAPIDASENACWQGDGGPPTYIPPIDVTIPGGLCAESDSGTTRAMVLQSTGHQDYGSGFGSYQFGGMYGFLNRGTGPGDCDSGPPQFIDASQYEGVSFWARNPSQCQGEVCAETTKGITFEITDIHTLPTNCPAEGGCVNYSTDAGNNVMQVVSGNGTLPPGSSVASAQPLPDACGNNFAVTMLTTEDWKLYTLPFSSFHQAFQPNRQAGGLDTTQLAGFVIQVPKEAVLNLWIANLGFYRHKN